jgi:hypothetical protein
MKAAPTLEGGLRIDIENVEDWKLLHAIIPDATGHQKDLASRLGGLISSEAGAEDWQEYIVPDLRESFQDDLNLVSAAIEAAMFHASGGAGPVWITPNDCFAWYSALNQARLAIEERFRFGPGDTIDLSKLTASRRAAFIRSKFYCQIQSFLLEFVMK